jgi:hypothetical protein
MSNELESLEVDADRYIYSSIPCQYFWENLKWHCSSGVFGIFPSFVPVGSRQSFFFRIDTFLSRISNLDEFTGITVHRAKLPMN